MQAVHHAAEPLVVDHRIQRLLAEQFDVPPATLEEFAQPCLT